MRSVRLTDPVQIGSRQAPARVVFGPHETNLGQGRLLSDRHVAYYARRAQGGCGVIVTETASVVANDWPYERAPLAAECGPGWQAVAVACQPFGALVLAGLGHAGGQGSSAYSQEVMWAPSRVADVVAREPPAALDEPGIRAVVDGFATAARVATTAGLDGVEIDAGAWSLLRQFHSGLTNQRGDAYGVDLLLVTRLVLDAVRHAIGPSRVLALRLSCDELAPWAGITPEHAASQVSALADQIDLLTVIRAGPYSTGAYRPDAHTPATTNLDLCRAMRDAAGGRVPVVLQGNVVDPDAADAALADGAADLVEMTRAQIADAGLVAHLRAGTPERIRPCILCNQTCRVRDNRNPIVTCVGDPRSGHETQDVDPDVVVFSSPSPSSDRPVLVVGAGPAGLECARVLARHGRRVGVTDGASTAGGTLAAVAVGAGRERLRALTDWLVAECTRLGVDIALDRHLTAAAIEAARADGWDVVLATGSRPVTDRYGGGAAGAGGLAVLDALQLLAGGAEALPQGPVVVDDPIGDWVGVAVAEWLAATGRPEGSITLVSPDPIAGTLLARTGDLADANVRLQRAGVHRQLRSRITAIGGGDHGGHVDVEDVWTGSADRLPAALVVDCGHRLPEDSLWQELGDPSIPRVGDCIAPRTMHEAVLEGRRAALALVGVGASLVGVH